MFTCLVNTICDLQIHPRSGCKPDRFTKIDTRKFVILVSSRLSSSDFGLWIYEIWCQTFCSPSLLWVDSDYFYFVSYSYFVVHILISELVLQSHLYSFPYSIAAEHLVLNTLVLPDKLLLVFNLFTEPPKI